MFLSLLVATAWAATPSEIAHVDYLTQTGRPDEAAAQAAALLRRDPSDPSAHHVYIQALASGMREGPPLEAQYRRQIVHDPSSEVARVALADLLSLHARSGTPWCDEVEALLTNLPVDPTLRAAALRVRYRSRLACPADEAADRAALIALTNPSAPDQAMAIGLRVSSGAVDQALAAEMGTFFAANPGYLLHAAGLWGATAYGPGLASARKAVLEAAGNALAGSSPEAVYQAIGVFEAAGDALNAEAAGLRLGRLDPAAISTGIATNGRVSWIPHGNDLPEDVVNAIERASQKASPKAVLTALKGLAPMIPASGPLRGRYLMELAFAQDELGEGGAMLDAMKNAWLAAQGLDPSQSAPQGAFTSETARKVIEASPSTGSVANAFAYTAALEGRDLEQALAVIDGALAVRPDYDPRSEFPGFLLDDWSKHAAHRSAARLDTRAWVLHRLGRNEEALESLRQALLLNREPDAVYHLHAGLLYAAVGQEGLALEHLGYGLALGAMDEGDLEEESWDVAARLFDKLRWADGDLEDWVATRLPSAWTGYGTEGIMGVDRTGQPFPDLAFRSDGQDRRISFVEGIRVVEIWAGDSEPCADILPLVEETALTFGRRDVSVIALSVDDEEDDVAWFWGGAKTPPYTVGWIGSQAAQELHVLELPVFFLLDAKGVVQGEIQGVRRTDDRRLEQALEDLLATPGAR